MPWMIQILLSKVTNYIKISHSFLTEQTFFIAKDAADTIALFTFLALCGHCVTQRMQDMHFLLSAEATSDGLIAFTGHCFAHKPQFTQSFVAFGTNPAPPAFL